MKGGYDMLDGIIQLTGKTGYIVRGNSLLVLYFLSDTEAVMIDSGEFYDPAFIKFLDAQNIRVSAVINTHIHEDHVANNRAFIEHWGTTIYASHRDLLTMRSKTLITLERGYRSEAYIKETLEEADYPITPIHEGCRELEIYGARFEIIDLPGHTFGHIGIVTPDGVCCLGDALLTKFLVQNSRMPYFANMALTIDSMCKIQTLDYPYFALAHRKIVKKEAMASLTEANLQHEMDILDAIHQVIEEPISIDDIGRYVLENMHFYRILNGKYAEPFEHTVKTRVHYLEKLGRIKIMENIVYKI